MLYASSKPYLLFCHPEPAFCAGEGSAFSALFASGHGFSPPNARTFSPSRTTSQTEYNRHPARQASAITSGRNDAALAQ